MSTTTKLSSYEPHITCDMNNNSSVCGAGDPDAIHVSHCDALESGDIKLALSYQPVNVRNFDDADDDSQESIEEHLYFQSGVSPSFAEQDDDVSTLSEKPGGAPSLFVTLEVDAASFPTSTWTDDDKSLSKSSTSSALDGIGLLDDSTTDQEESDPIFVTCAEENASLEESSDGLWSDDSKPEKNKSKERFRRTLFAYGLNPDIVSAPQVLLWAISVTFKEEDDSSEESDDGVWSDDRKPKKYTSKERFRRTLFAYGLKPDLVSIPQVLSLVLIVSLWCCGCIHSAMSNKFQPPLSAQALAHVQVVSDFAPSPVSDIVADLMVESSPYDQDLSGFATSHVESVTAAVDGWSDPSFSQVLSGSAASAVDDADSAATFVLTTAKPTYLSTFITEPLAVTTPAIAETPSPTASVGVCFVPRPSVISIHDQGKYFHGTEGGRSFGIATTTETLNVVARAIAGSPSPSGSAGTCPFPRPSMVAIIGEGKEFFRQEIGASRTSIATSDAPEPTVLTPNTDEMPSTHKALVVVAASMIPITTVIPMLVYPVRRWKFRSHAKYVRWILKFLVLLFWYKLISLFESFTYTNGIRRHVQPVEDDPPPVRDHDESPGKPVPTLEATPDRIQASALPVHDNPPPIGGQIEDPGEPEPSFLDGDDQVEYEVEPEPEPAPRRRRRARQSNL